MARRIRARPAALGDQRDRWLAGAHPTGLTPPSEQEPATDAHLQVIRWHGRSVPVPTLEIQLAVAARRGLTERVELIRRAMAE